MLNLSAKKKRKEVERKKNEKREKRSEKCYFRRVSACAYSRSIVGNPNRQKLKDFHQSSERSCKRVFQRRDETPRVLFLSLFLFFSFVPRFLFCFLCLFFFFRSRRRVCPRQKSDTLLAERFPTLLTIYVNSARLTLRTLRYRFNRALALVYLLDSAV